MGQPIIVRIPVRDDDIEFTDSEMQEIANATLRVVEKMILAKRGQ